MPDGIVATVAFPALDAPGRAGVPTQRSGASAHASGFAAGFAAGARAASRAAAQAQALADEQPAEVAELLRGWLAAPSGRRR